MIAGRKRKILGVALVVAVCLGVVVTRAIWDGRSALAQGDAAAEAGDIGEAIRWWRRAARWYVPGAPHVGSAYDRLEATARAARERGDRATALAAWQGVRGSILATRSFFTPHAERLGPANEAIASLMAEAEGPAADPGRPEAERRSWHLELLTRDEAPSVAWSVVALAGFALWLGGGILFATRAITADDRLLARPALVSGIVVAVGLVVWMLGLALA